jgi:NADPH:quinone reductase-like Zn-dependent oxidoreductase
MRAAVLHTHGQPPRCEEFAEPTAGENEVLVEVQAAALKPVDRQMAAGAHYASPRQLPAICGADGVGRLSDGSRVLFNMPRPPYGGMAQRTVVAARQCLPVPDEVDDVTAAATFNPGMAAWKALIWRGELSEGQTVLVLGATGASGRLAIQWAKLHGAGRIVAAGRNQQVLDSLHALGADATIRLDQAPADLVGAFTDAAHDTGYDVVVDYVWGPPAEALITTLTGTDLTAAASARTRLVQVGQLAGPTIALPAAALRSSGLEILGSGSGVSPSGEVVMDAYHRLMALAAEGEFVIDIEQVPLTDIEQAWQRDPQSPRLVITP